MSWVIGVVCEGPTDYEVIRRVVDMITQEENEYMRLQPEEPPVGQYGNGWKGVWKWCEEHGPILRDYMRKATPQLDCLIVHMDGDVSRNEKEVHCACAPTVCEQVGAVHPLRCPVCKEGKCPVVLPCAGHELDSSATHLRGLITKWLCISEESAPVIITIPCDSIDTWVAVAYGDLITQSESYPNPWNSLIARGAYYHSIRIQGGKKRVLVYRKLAENICNNWDVVKERCSQAQAFESALYEMLLS